MADKTFVIKSPTFVRGKHVQAGQTITIDDETAEGLEVHTLLQGADRIRDFTPEEKAEMETREQDDKRKSDNAVKIGGQASQKRIDAEAEKDPKLQLEGDKTEDKVFGKEKDAAKKK